MPKILLKTKLFLFAVLLTTAAYCDESPKKFYGSMFINSTPAQARVYLDGQFRATTPCTLLQIAPGEHKLSLLEKGYKPFSKTVKIESAKRLVGNIRLENDTTIGVKSGMRDSSRQDRQAPSKGVDTTVPEKNDYVAMDKAPEVIRKVDPIYPVDAKQNGIAGKVYLQLLVDVDGLVIRCDVAKSSGYLELDDAAIVAASQWMFTPAIAPGNKPVRVWVMQAFTFKLKE